MTPKKEVPRSVHYHPSIVAPQTEVIDDGDSASSTTPLSPPQNNKKIDNYFTPRDARGSISRSLFESKQPASSGDVHSISSPEVLSTPTHSRDVLHSPQKPSVPVPDPIIEVTTSCDTRNGIADVRSNDIHMLLMSKDTRIKELEHVLSLLSPHVQELQDLKSTVQSIASKEQSLATQQEEMLSLKENYKKDVETLKGQLLALQSENQEFKDNSRKALEKWIRNYAFALLYKKQDQVIRDDLRVGSVVLQQMGHRVVETWREGSVGGVGGK